ncbi:signal peptide protein [Alkalihalobacillus alcalophilus ATCC 27647 = CGMCC 1.3604]|uniref:Signal peptide protein n=1 Tax=Alkalihalobacillus alcalophilus ATCC 27647 = CGMCC 1.3604 TaxID=1218173 RepID=A0A094YRR1_ALKAL|nr:signal peptide peptidase SppA [Alkalihalobacillus alcalophilus]KGA96182.1 signal peptide protein [Alkalihalobacillus alcalophilus ATCC 27647 = CGMCC 1.3604]MED1561496.1 signal peptide peptidase SppA [Alkalihalobacillus alcalophilus]THG91539.1 signal peptide protein [Alkalihalobacillus alcalophilus ATCC 27647 = CGMCC 1.3604]
MNGKRWMALGAVVVLVGVAIFMNFLSFAQNALQEIQGTSSVTAGHEEIVEVGTASGKIVVIELDGVIQDTGGNPGFFAVDGYNHEKFLEQMDTAAKDSAVKGIILDVNTPGGGVVESAEIYERILKIQDEYEKPVYISMGNMAASGGYYIAAPANKIYANNQTITGSIGVIMESINIAGLAEQFGIEVNTIKSGEFKDIMSSTREMTDEEREILQSIIDESFDEFVRIIAEGRDMSEQEVREIADGRIYTGKQAFELGLVDELGNLETVIAGLKEELGQDYTVVKYSHTTQLTDLLRIAAPKINLNPEHEAAAMLQFLQEQRTPTLKYLYAE